MSICLHLVTAPPIHQIDTVGSEHGSLRGRVDCSVASADDSDPRTAEVHSTCTHIRDEVECVGHAFEILAFQTKWRHRSESDAEKQRFMSCKQFVDRNVAPDSCLPNLNAETFQKVDLTQRRRLVHLVVGYAVRDETARLIVRVVDDDAVAE